jgi:hypothetical protein
VAIYQAGYTLDNKAYNDLKSGQSFHHFYGIFGYIDQMSGEERIYEFNTKLRQLPASGLDMLTNDNWGIWEYEMKHRVMINK